MMYAYFKNILLSFACAFSIVYKKKKVAKNNAEKQCQRTYPV